MQRIMDDQLYGFLSVLQELEKDTVTVVNDILNLI